MTAAIPVSDDHRALLREWAKFMGRLALPEDVPVGMEFLTLAPVLHALLDRIEALEECR